MGLLQELMRTKLKSNNSSSSNSHQSHFHPLFFSDGPLLMGGKVSPSNELLSPEKSSAGCPSFVASFEFGPS